MLSFPERNPAGTQAAHRQTGTFCPRQSRSPLGSLPPIPILQSTRLQLDLLLDQPALILNEISGVILTDVGATLQLFRETAGLRSREVGGPEQISDCVVFLGRRRLQRALDNVFPPEPTLTAELARLMWTRARYTAELARLMAQRHCGVTPGKAYLAGLLHEMGRIPWALGCHTLGIDLGDTCAVSSAMIKEWGLPTFVESSLQSPSASRRSPSPLPRLVAAAWNCANSLSEVQDSPVRGLAGSLAVRVSDPGSRFVPNSRDGCLPFLVQ